jgi:hypothetical protein
VSAFQNLTQTEASDEPQITIEAKQFPRRYTFIRQSIVAHGSRHLSCTAKFRAAEQVAGG